MLDMEKYEPGSWRNEEPYSNPDNKSLSDLRTELDQGLKNLEDNFPGLDIYKDNMDEKISDWSEDQQQTFKDISYEIMNKIHIIFSSNLTDNENENEYYSTLKELDDKLNEWITRISILK